MERAFEFCDLLVKLFDSVQEAIIVGLEELLLLEQDVGMQLFDTLVVGECSEFGIALLLPHLLFSKELLQVLGFLEVALEK